MYFISLIEKEIGIEAKKEYLPMQPGDVTINYADIDKAQRDLGFEPKIGIEEGIKRFVEWFKEYNNIK